MSRAPVSGNACAPPARGRRRVFGAEGAPSSSLFYTSRWSSALSARAAFSRRSFSPLLLSFLLFLPSCYSRVIHYSPPLSNLPNAQTGVAVTGPKGEYIDPRKLPADKLVVQNDDGTVTLHARTGRHLMVHIYNCLQKNDSRLFVDQVLSERTKAQYAARGLDPAQAFETIKARREDLVALFNAMPYGEFTPGLFLLSAPGGGQRLMLQGAAARDLRWTGFDMLMEHGDYRLAWFTGE